MNLNQAILSIDSLPAIIVASHRAEIQSYDKLRKLCYMTIGPEMSRLRCECPEPGYCYTIEHGGYRQENTDIKYCEQVATSPQYSYVDSTGIRKMRRIG